MAAAVQHLCTPYILYCVRKHYRSVYISNYLHCCLYSKWGRTRRRRRVPLCARRLCCPFWANISWTRETSWLAAAAYQMLDNSGTRTSHVSLISFLICHSDVPLCIMWPPDARFHDIPSKQMVLTMGPQRGFFLLINSLLLCDIINLLIYLVSFIVVVAVVMRSRYWDDKETLVVIKTPNPTSRTTFM